MSGEKFDRNKVRNGGGTMSKPVLTKLHTINGAQYLVTSEGRVFGKKGEIKLRPNSDGYASFTAGRKGNRISVCVHRLVAEDFVPNPFGLPEVDHLDNNRMNPSADNLEWVTHQENIDRAYKRGSHIGRAVGERNTKAKLTEELVLQMRKEYRTGVTVRNLQKKYPHPYNTISNAVRGLTWTHLPLIP